MAHFAQLDSGNKVIKIHVVNNAVITDADGNEQEQLGIDFLIQLYGTVGWFKQTSYNGTFRKRYAAVGYSYNRTLDAFILPKPYSSWTLNEDTRRWEAPVAPPDDGKKHTWDEYNRKWEEEEI